MFNATKIETMDRLMTNQDGRFHSLRYSRAALSLIEIMIALTMTLIVLGAMMTAFQSVSRRMQDGRALIELANRVRNVESTLRSDLTSMTVEPRPYTTTFPPGYFEYVEGPRNDSTMVNSVNSVMGDVDDVLAMTIQSKGKLFRGRYVNATGATTIVESPIAEVTWFTVWNENGNIGVPEFEDFIELRRRVLLVLPNITLNSPGGTGYWTWDQVRAFFANNDISVRIEPIADQVDRFVLVPNQLADLAVRKNRFGHMPAAVQGNRGAFLTWPIVNNPPVVVSVNSDQSPLGFPNRLNYQMLLALTSPDDVVLTDLVGFDLRVFSPNASVWHDGANPAVANMLIEPGDFNQASGTLHGPYGAFVDLNGGGNGWFSGSAAPRSQLSNVASSWPPGALVNENTFDSWTPFYESDGIDQDYSGAGSIVDQGTDGLDNDNANGVDDIGERETHPPYNHPMRGIEIRIRTVERVTKQVHQVRVVQSFVPE